MLGSLFLQNFKFQIDYSIYGSEDLTTVTLAKNYATGVNGVYLGTASYDSMKDPFAQAERQYRLLVIGLPIICGSILIAVIVGICCWRRKRQQSEEVKEVLYD